METDLDTLELTEFVSVSEPWRGINLRVGTMAEAPDPRNHDQQDIRSPITSSDIKEEDPEGKTKEYLLQLAVRYYTKEDFTKVWTSQYWEIVLYERHTAMSEKHTRAERFLLRYPVHAHASVFIRCHSGLTHPSYFIPWFFPVNAILVANSFITVFASQPRAPSTENVAAQFHGTSQQDCQEYLTAVLETLHTALKSPPNYISCASDALATQADEFWLNYLSTHGNSIVVDTFQGQLQTHLQCQQCKAVFKRFDPFASIATPIRITEVSGIISINPSNILLQYSTEMDPTEMDPTEMNPNRDEPKRNGPNRVEPTRDDHRDGSITDETLIRGKDVEHKDENLSSQNSQLGELKAELEKKNTQIEQLQKILDEKDKEIESLKNNYSKMTNPNMCL
eukprot:Em0005g152a